MLLCAVPGAAVVVANVHGDHGEEGLTSLSMQNISNKSSLMWVHVVAM